MSYDKATKLLLSFEAAEKEMKDLVGDKSEKPEVHQVRARQPPKKSSQEEPKERSCHRCGGTHDQAKCRFRQAECRYCHKRGHIAAVCRQKAKQFRSDSGARARGTRPTHTVAESQEIDPPEYPMYSFHSSESQPLAVELQIQNVPVRMEVDTGASLSIMSHQTYSSTWSKECLPPYEEILDISLYFTLILTFSCCSLSMANTGDEVIYLHYFNFVKFFKKSVGEILILHAICFKMIPLQL